MNPLTRLGASELRALAAAAADGRLDPATPGVVGRFVADGASVAKVLEQLASSASPVAATLRLLAEAAERRAAVENFVELVLTGPNTGTGRDTGIVVRQLFREARKSVWVCDLVAAGRVKLSRVTEDGRRVFVDIYQQEEFFGDPRSWGCKRVRKS